MWALERFLPGVRVAVDLQARGSTKGFVAGLADVPVLRLRELRLRGLVDVVVVFPDSRWGARVRHMR